MINILKTLRSNPDFFGELDVHRPSTISSVQLALGGQSRSAIKRLPQRRWRPTPTKPVSALTLGPSKKIALNTINDNPQQARLLRVIERNVINDWSLEYYARSIGMSLSTFKRVFHEVFDEPSPKAWLVRQRLRYAHAKLKHSNANLLDIALDCGFSSQSYFTQAYKKRYGVAPSKVRKHTL